MITFKIICSKCGNETNLSVKDEFLVFNGLSQFDEVIEKEGIIIRAFDYDGQIKIVCNKCGNEIHDEY